MAGKMIKKPNSLQRLIHRFAALRPVSLFFAPRMHHFDGMLLKFTNDRYTVSEFLGWHIVQLKTTGAKTGKSYTSPLIATLAGDKIALIASSFGRPHNPGWYYNLIKTPQCEVYSRGISGQYLARETVGEEREKYWQMALLYYTGYEKYKERAAHRHIPVLEPVK